MTDPAKSVIERLRMQHGEAVAALDLILSGELTREESESRERSVQRYEDDMRRHADALLAVAEAAEELAELQGKPVGFPSTQLEQRLKTLADTVAALRSLHLPA